MNETVLDERVGADVPVRPAPVISVRSLLLRLLIAVVMIATLSIGGAWLMYATIDPTAEASAGGDTLFSDHVPVKAGPTARVTRLFIGCTREPFCHGNFAAPCRVAPKPSFPAPGAWYVSLELLTPFVVDRTAPRALSRLAPCRPLERYR